MVDELTLSDQIQLELNEWQKMGMPDPVGQGVLSPNHFLESVKLRALLELLMETFVVSQEQMEEAYKKSMLASLSEARAGIMQQRRDALGVPKLVIPRGKIQ